MPKQQMSVREAVQLAYNQGLDSEAIQDSLIGYIEENCDSEDFAEHFCNAMDLK